MYDLAADRSLANGGGKTTLLRLLSGKHLTKNGTVAIAGLDPFDQSLEGVTYLGAEWVLNPIVRTDMDVVTLLASVGGNHYSNRRDELVRILDIDLTWRMHIVSDGEKKSATGHGLAQTMDGFVARRDHGRSRSVEP